MMKSAPSRNLFFSFNVKLSLEEICDGKVFRDTLKIKDTRDTDGDLTDL